MSYKEINSDLRGSAKDFPEHASMLNAAADAIQSQALSIEFLNSCVDTVIQDRKYFENDRNRLQAINTELLKALEKAIETTYSDTLHTEWTAIIRKAKGDL